MKITLASALLRRKELKEKIDQLKQINVRDLFEVKVQRKNVTESIDDIVAQVPKIKIEQVTSAFDWHARRMREIDLVIQQANHTTVVDVPDGVMEDYQTK